MKVYKRRTRPPISPARHRHTASQFHILTPAEPSGTAYTNETEECGWGSIWDLPRKNHAPSRFGVCFPLWMRPESQAESANRGLPSGHGTAWLGTVAHSRSWGSNALSSGCRLSSHHCLNINSSGNFYTAVRNFIGN